MFVQRQRKRISRRARLLRKIVMTILSTQTPTFEERYLEINFYSERAIARIIVFNVTSMRFLYSLIFVFLVLGEDVQARIDVSVMSAI